MMDTSDGLADALFKIAEESGVTIAANYDKIPHPDGLDKELVLFGGEDYKPVAAIPEKYVNFIEGASVIGKVVKYNGIRLDISGIEFRYYNDLKVFNHFKNN